KLDKLPLLIILLGRADVEDLIPNCRSWRTQCRLYCPRRIPHMDVGPPKLLAEDNQAALGQHFHSELVDRKVEPHAGGNTEDRSETEGCGTKAASLRRIKQHAFDRHLRFGIKRNW